MRVGTPLSHADFEGKQRPQQPIVCQENHRQSAFIVAYCAFLLETI